MNNAFQFLLSVLVNFMVVRKDLGLGPQRQRRYELTVPVPVSPVRLLQLPAGITIEYIHLVEALELASNCQAVLPVAGPDLTKQAVITLCRLQL